MNDTGIGRYNRGFALSLAITSLLSALLVVIKEENQDSVLAWMIAATGHHWVTHGVLVLVLYAVLGWILAQLQLGTRLTGNGLSAVISGSLVVSGLIIAGYFI
ncbi:hypothetical protein GCM10011352_18150 [Marinobacterium zhoushanense]|uniref:Uncharacterized protein n=1 Tax=Marinobacterium zhoushanense TaxID=1679163 RepID=A0ABQ1KF52_9GAMM|nr:hypothetical protein [Marinobacterium zhoushanense]GGB92460.1 hypothetical protein GCM10011352_18150 [Marinobacterium zhoushanense]